MLVTVGVLGVEKQKKLINIESITYAFLTPLRGGRFSSKEVKKTFFWAGRTTSLGKTGIPSFSFFLWLPHQLSLVSYKAKIFFKK